MKHFQVNEKQRRPGQNRALFYFEKDDHRQFSLLDGISEFLQPTISEDLSLLKKEASKKSDIINGTSEEKLDESLKVCPMIPPNLHGAVKVVSL